MIQETMSGFETRWPFWRLWYSLVFLGLLFFLCSCGLPPEVLLSDGTSATYTVNSYAAVGDSITYGSFLSSYAIQAYPARIAWARKWSLKNYAVPGDMACDLFPQQIIPNKVAFTASPGLAYSMLIGTNDADVRGMGDYEANFAHCQLAAITWLATRPEDKLLPGSSSVSASGTCTNIQGNSTFSCNGSGALDFGSITTNGAPIYLWYAVSDGASYADTFTVTIDGTPVNIDTKPETSLQTFNGSSSSVFLLRVPAATGSHRVQVSASSPISILALASNRTSKPIVVAVGDIPNQLLSHPIASVTTQLAYIQLSRQNITTATSDGLDVRLVQDRDYMLGTDDEMTDQVHPNPLGHIHLAQAFSTQLP